MTRNETKWKIKLRSNKGQELEAIVITDSPIDAMRNVKTKYEECSIVAITSLKEPRHAHIHKTHNLAIAPRK